MIEDSENPNTYQGSYTGFPQYGVCVDLRTVIFGDDVWMALNTEQACPESQMILIDYLVCYLKIKWYNVKTYK